jgi:hypothetical protein
MLACVVGLGWPELGHAQPFIFTQLTNTTGGSNVRAATNAAGTRIAFDSTSDLTPGAPGNADGNREIFLVDTTTATFTQLTNTTGIGIDDGNFSPAINAAGTRIAFQSTRDLTPGAPGNADGNQEIFLFDTTTATFTQLTNTTGGANSGAAINSNGTRIAFESNRNLTPGAPGNADGNFEIFLFDTTTATFTQLTNTTGGDNFSAAINAVGTRIAFDSDRNLTPGAPGNADGNTEIFLFDTTTATFTQLTNTTGGNNIFAAIDAAGTRIAFQSNRDLTPGAPGNADGNTEIFLASTAATLTNLSTRALVQTGGDVMIAGLTIGGDSAKRVLIRGLGPTLGLPPFNVPGALADPVLQLFPAGQIVPIAQSDNWMTLDPLCLPPAQACEGPAAITATGLAPPQAQEAAVLVTLLPGAYTAILSGVAQTTGAGLIDVNEVP